MQLVEKCMQSVNMHRHKICNRNPMSYSDPAKLANIFCNMHHSSPRTCSKNEAGKTGVIDQYHELTKHTCNFNHAEMRDFWSLFMKQIRHETTSGNAHHPISI